FTDPLVPEIMLPPPPWVSPAFFTGHGASGSPLQLRWPVTVVLLPPPPKDVPKPLPCSSAAARVNALKVDPAWKPVLPPRSESVAKLIEVSPSLDSSGP